MGCGTGNGMLSQRWGSMGLLELDSFCLVVPRSWSLAIRSNCLWFVLGLRGSLIDCNSAMKYETEHDF